MSQADELLNNLASNGISTYSVDSDTEEHIVIDSNRFITVPEALERIAVQNDHNIETVTFDCPRYWDGHDMSKMTIYINYKCPDGTLGSYIADDVTIDEDDETIIHFKWTISRAVTGTKGKLSFLVCVKNVETVETENLVLTDWFTLNVGIDGETLRDIVYGDGTYVAVGYGGTIYHSYDAINWTVSKSVETENLVLADWVSLNIGNDGETLRDIVYGDGTYVAVGYGGTIYHSYDAINWTVSKSVGESLVAITYGNGIFLAAGEEGGMYNSEDGITWSLGHVVSSNIHKITDIAYGNGKFVVTGYTASAGSVPGQQRAYYSEDGVTWTKCNDICDHTGYANGVTYGNKKFILVGSGYIYYSTDGINWKAGSDPETSMNGVVYGDKKYVAVGISGATYYSTDGINWTAGGTAGSSALKRVIYGNGNYIAVGYDGCIYISTDGINWTTEYTTDTGVLYGAEFANNKFIVVGKEGATYYSDFVYAMESFVAITYGNGIFLAAGEEGYIYKSEDGITWSLGHVVSSNIHKITDIAYGNGKFVVTGYSASTGSTSELYRVYYSEDGITWSKCSGVHTQGGIPNGVTYGNKKFILVGSGNVYYSEDGITWTAGSNPETSINDVVYGDKKYVAVGNKGYTYISEDGVTWTAGSTAGSNDLNAVTYGNGKYIAVSEDGCIYISANGINWVAEYATDTGVLYGAEFINDRFVVVGKEGAIYYSDFVYATESVESNHWNSELNDDLYISEGLEADPAIETFYPDLYTQLLYRMDQIEEISSTNMIEAKAATEAAKTSEANAKASEEAASMSATEASLAAMNAETSATNASVSETNAKNYANTATTEAGNAEKYASEAKTSAESAETLADNALESYNNAVTSANNAKASETNAATSASTASTKASAAATSEANAKNYANTATNKASAASTSATNAKTSEENAKASEEAAATSATNAETSEEKAREYAEAAATSATEAKTSEANAKASEEAASMSATNATTSASNAAKSETNAKNYANTATNKASAASTSATNASVSETNAKASEEAAATSATNASVSETNTKASEEAASTSATNAANSATNAKASEEAAATSATNAKTSEEKAREYAEASSGIGTLISSFATGTNPTIQDSTNAPLIYGKFKGYTLQDGEPTPDNPVEINGLAKDGAIKVKTCGKNLYNTEDRIDGVIIDNGAINTDKVSYKHTPIKVLPNTVYTLSMNDGNNIDGGYAFYTKQHEFIKVIKGLSSSNSKSHTFTTPANCYYVYLNDNIETDRKYQLEVGDTATPYEPYTETTTAITTYAPLYEGDYIEIYADGSGKLVRKMKEIVLDENVSYNATTNANSTGDTIYFDVSTTYNSYKYKGVLKCVELTNQAIWSTDVEGIMYEGSTGAFSIRFRIKKSRLVSADVDGLKAWLAENPLHIVVELAEPTETPLTAEQVAQFKQLYTFEPVTNVFCDGEVEVLYYKNTDNGETVGIVHKKVEKNERVVNSVNDYYSSFKQTFDTVVGGKVSDNISNVEYTKPTFSNGSIFGMVIKGGTLVDGLKSVTTKIAETLSSMCDFFATKSLYDDTTINIGRKAGTTVGGYSTAEGYQTTASGSSGSHAEGSSTMASGNSAHAEGGGSTASGTSSHAEGSMTTASGQASHAEGMGTTASGNESHAEGHNTKAVGDFSHAEGYATTANKVCSHAEGYYTKASGVYSHVQGKFNAEDTENKYAHIVGGGTSDTERKNIHTLDWKGNAVFAGDVVAHDESGNEISLRKIADGTILKEKTAVIIANNVSSIDIDIASFGLTSTFFDIDIFAGVWNSHLFFHSKISVWYYNDSKYDEILIFDKYNNDSYHVSSTSMNNGILTVNFTNDMSYVRADVTASRGYNV